MVPIVLAVLNLAPIFLPPLMRLFERKLPNPGQGPARKDAIMRTLEVAAKSLANDGILTDPEIRELILQIGPIIEAFVPVMNAERQAEATLLNIAKGTAIGRDDSGAAYLPVILTGSLKLVPQGGTS